MDIKFLVCNFLVCVGLVGLISVEGTEVDIDVGFCAVQDQSAYLNCTGTEDRFLIWIFNLTLLGSNCRIAPEYEDRVEIYDDYCSGNGIFNIKILQFTDDLKGLYTCMYNVTVRETVKLLPNTSNVCTAASTEPDNPANEAETFSSNEKGGKVTLEYIPDGCYYPDPLFRWFGPDGEITDGITTSPTSANCPYPQQNAYISSIEATFPDTEITEAYTCKVAYEDSPDFFVNEKKFYVASLQENCSPGLCIALPIVLILAAGGIIAGVVYYFKRPSTNEIQ